VAQVFLSYSREDKERVKPLVDAFEDEGLSVWWDRDLSPGQSFEETIDREIQLADCIVVIWSRHSINSQWVKNEALEGMDRDALVPILLDDVRIPVAFKQTQGADFRQWPFTIDKEEYKKLIDVVNEKLNRTPGSDDLIGVKRLTPRGRRRTRRKSDFYFPAAIALMLLLIAATFYFREPAIEEKTIPRLTILPFSEGRGDDAKFYADSMTSELGQRFGQFDDLTLVQVSSVWDLDLLAMPQAVMQEESDYAITGLVSSDNDQVLVEARLRDLGADEIIWQSSYSESPDNLFELQQKLVLGVVSQLKLNSAKDFNAHQLKAVTTNKSAYRDYLRGADLLRRGEQHHIQQALGKFELAVEKDPQFAVAYAAMCRAYLERYQISTARNEYDLGKTNCDLALAIDANQPAVQLALAELYRTNGELELAKYHYTRTLEIDSRDADATMGLAAIFASENDLETAEELYLKATRLKPTYWKAQNMLGAYYFRQGLYFQAMESWLRVTQLTTANATAYNNLGAAQFYAGNFDAAYQSWKRASDLFTNSASYSNMGTALYLLNRFDEALEQFEIAIEMDPEDHRLWGNVGDNHRFIPGHHNEVVSSYRKAAELAESNLAVNPNDYTANSRLAVYYSALNQVEEAQSIIERSEKLAGDDFNVLYDLAVASSLLNDMEAAKVYVQRALDAGYPEVMYNSDPQFKELELHND
jgi:tetratricopeptide (TPR) repeat protein